METNTPQSQARLDEFERKLAALTAEFEDLQRAVAVAPAPAKTPPVVGDLQPFPAREPARHARAPAAAGHHPAAAATTAAAAQATRTRPARPARARDRRRDRDAARDRLLLRPRREPRLDRPACPRRARRDRFDDRLRGRPRAETALRDDALDARSRRSRSRRRLRDAALGRRALRDAFALGGTACRRRDRGGGPRHSRSSGARRSSAESGFSAQCSFRSSSRRRVA